MKDKLISLVAANILLGIIIYWISYVPASQRNEGTYFFGFGEIVTLVIIYAGPAYLLAGLPCSYIIEKYTKRKNGVKGYFLRLGLYSAAGLATGLFYSLIVFREMPVLIEGGIIFLGLSLIASTVYYHILLVVTCRSNRRENQLRNIM
ncbi:hypothetical protein [Halobacillus sp. Marseille-P3879]|uniref:hypothetical protein n=1 Tax=Halobacillus sp. Marseille-P3879 TaxID=2045014 RepID=UPI000C79A5F0|nr:hypothetical protein [Halobacillus sp. Marseille-P3879]